MKINKINKIRGPLKRIEAKIDYLIIEDEINDFMAYYRLFLLITIITAPIFYLAGRKGGVFYAILFPITYFIAAIVYRHIQQTKFKKRYFKRG